MPRLLHVMDYEPRGTRTMDHFVLALTAALRRRGVGGAVRVRGRAAAGVPGGARGGGGRPRRRPVPVHPRVGRRAGAAVVRLPPRRDANELPVGVHPRCCG
ncbi:hypothetical protein FTUN_5643 [Frigoriglobus tundricola]|uniref:Uncharacterized protein n=1 Tax=Frigoriglobus tundricola TaxID=2774151 RepID=A0A6M5YXY8_9BACT|nr:hypothetical protein FTUN_5643 [Frigoriglobus tundricola]